MPTHEELCSVVFILMILVFLLAILVIMLERHLFKHIAELKKERVKNELEKHDLAIINKTREIVFDDLCDYFESTKGTDYESKRKS